MKKLWSKRDDERGGMLVLAAGSLVVMLIAAAFAIDLGRLSTEKRFDQKIADLAALDASRQLPVPGLVKTAAEESATRNGFSWTTSGYATDGFDLNICLGTMSSGTFAPGPSCNAGTVVRVQADSAFSTAFPFVTGPDGVNAKAVAGVQPEAAFSIGSSLATLDTSRAAVLDDVLEAIFPGSGTISLGLAGYQGLASSTIGLGPLAGELGFGTVDELLTSNVSMFDLYEATANVLQAGGDTANANIFNALKAQVTAMPPIQLGEFITVGPGAGTALESEVDLFNLLMGSAQVANGTNAVSIPVVGVSLPLNLSNLAISAQLIEGPRIGIGPVGTSVTTNQGIVTVSLDVSVLFVGLVHVNINLNAGQGTATLAAIRCGSPAGIDLGVTTHAVTTTVDARLVGAPLNVTATGLGGTTVAYPPGVSFDYPSEFGLENAQHVPGGRVALGPAPTFSGSGTGALVATLLNTIRPVWNNVLNPLLAPVFGALGLDVGAADVAALAMLSPPPQCATPTLLQ